jgi:integral membrane protein (TIGR00529 family)
MPDWLSELLPLLKFLLLFAAIVIAMSRKWDLALVLGSASILLGLFFGMPIVNLGESILWGALDLKTIHLLALVFGIITFSEALKETGHLKKFIDSLQHLVPSYHLNMAIVPALVGLLPMPGGAVFSAPMLDELAVKAGVKTERKTFINHWFRHIWEYILPLYPGVLAAAALWEISVRKLVLHQAPLTLFAIIAGCAVAYLGQKFTRPLPEPVTRDRIMELIVGLWPFLMLIAGVLLVPVDILIVVYSMLVLLLIVDWVNFRRIWKIIKAGFRWRILLMVLAVMIFKQVMNDSGAAQEVAGTLVSFHLPLALVFFTLAFLVGLATGITIAFVGISFPILIPLLANISGDPMGLMMLAYCGGFLGTLISPLHLCLVLTNEYFGSNLVKTFRYFLPAVAIVAILAWGYYFLLWG